MRKVKILLVDDDEPLLRSLESILVHKGFEVTGVTNVPDALELISSQPFDVLLSDLNVGQPGDGFTVVSAMRRTQPQACTFILTGYPDFESAIRAIRNQVDDYFSKPLDVGQLVHAITLAQSGQKTRPEEASPQTVASLVSHLLPVITERWLQEVMTDEGIAALPLTRAERVDHVPELLRDLVSRLEQHTMDLSAGSVEAARKHGRARFHQGYTIPQVLCEGRVLQKVLSSIIQENLLAIELSTLVQEILEIGQSLQAELEVSIHEYQAQIPRSLQSSFSVLYKSPYLGVCIADENRLIDANDALLRMMGRTREELNAGGISWQRLTPEKFHAADEAALGQLREFGTCVPYEKEFILPDGTSLPFLVGAIRLGAAPLEWSAYVVDLTEQRRAAVAEQKISEWESRSALINQLAHEINNPLAALMFSTHLLSTHPALTDDMRSLLGDIGEMLVRVKDTVHRVLVESKG